MWLSPLVLITVIVLLFVEFGKAFAAGCAALIVLLIVEIGLGLVVGKMRQVLALFILLSTTTSIGLFEQTSLSIICLILPTFCITLLQNVTNPAI